MDKGLIPRRYAKALYEVARQRKCDTDIYNIMQCIADAFALNPSLADTMANPYVSTADKIALLKTAAASESKNATYDDFLKLLSQNNRLDLARDIALAYIDIYRRNNNIFKVAITSAAPLAQPEKDRLQALIQKHIGKGTMEYDYSIDPALIGGFTVTANSQRLDASVASALKNMQLQLNS